MAEVFILAQLLENSCNKDNLLYNYNLSKIFESKVTLAQTHKPRLSLCYK
jgi:hypothetical protein